ncbi:hypothetical protein AB0G73_34670 [Streptomyces sp. NPDC020719]|uniref:hypothetical protein n=1 Tax=Streptomyces sp. NPDC020719 TaxID=3154896 RepID=UPI0033F3B203
MGFAGSIQTVQRYLRPFKAATTAPPARRPAPQPRRIVRWIMTDPGNLTADEAADLKEIRTNCPELDSVTHHVREFATMMGDLRGEDMAEPTSTSSASASSSRPDPTTSQDQRQSPDRASRRRAMS